MFDFIDNVVSIATTLTAAFVKPLDDLIDEVKEGIEDIVKD